MSKATAAFLASDAGDEVDFGEITKPKVRVIDRKPCYRYILIDETPVIDMSISASMCRNDIQNYLAHIIGPSEAQNYRSRYPISKIVPHYMRLKGLYHAEYGENGAQQDAESFVGFFKILDDAYAETRARYEERVRSGKIEFDDVPIHLPIGAEVVYRDGPDAVAGTVASVEFVSTFFAGTYWKVQLKVIHNFHGAATFGYTSAKVPAWSGLAPIEDVPVKALTPDVRAALEERGRMFRQTAASAAYMRYKGELKQSSWMGVATYRADGRIMVDPRSCKKVDSSRAQYEAQEFGFERRSSDEGRVAMEILDKDLWCTFPYTLGFSFRTKKWGAIAVSGISQIEWRDDAYDLLVMPPEQKAIIKSLVTSGAGSFQDIVDEKGGGTIFLLEGPPGLGKTLTAETVAEMTRQPLYSISVGELGTDPESLEDTLREILDVATMWNAVLLLDEADIFLEARNAEDIVRNAMVGVFLRLLEYHQGILFLTTNRAANLDRAFLSRISVPLSFPPADAEKMRKIWHNLLSSAGIRDQFVDAELDALAEHPVNGRQVKNAIRIGQTLARADGRQVEYGDLLRPLAMAENFRRSVSPSRWVRLQGWWNGLWAKKPKKKPNRNIRNSGRDDYPWDDD